MVLELLSLAVAAPAAATEEATAAKAPTEEVAAKATTDEAPKA